MVEHENISLAAAALNMKELFLLFFSPENILLQPVC